jgi:hypothetical protein
MLVWYSPSPWSSGDDEVIPDYIQNDPAYGASPVAGSYGWWGRNSGGASTGMYAPAVYYPPVMDRYIALVQALGQHLDADPNVEAFFVQEESAIVQAAAGFGNNDPHYSDPAWLAQAERMLSAATAAFPHTSVIMGNAYFANGQSAVALEEWMAKNRIAAGTADTFGQSSILANHFNGLSDGVKAYLGVNTTNGGTTDLRPVMPAMFDVESACILDTHGGQNARRRPMGQCGGRVRRESAAPDRISCQLSMTVAWGTTVVAGSWPPPVRCGVTALRDSRPFAATTLVAASFQSRATTRRRASGGLDPSRSTVPDRDALPGIGRPPCARASHPTGPHRTTRRATTR